ncbi:MAG: hypothetical protein LUG64_00330 [Clostridiales bacterium]|nr:hypothetical protein [Clostridiales bacterium]
MNERSNDRISFVFALKQAGAIAWSRAFPRLGRLWSGIGVVLTVCSCFSAWIPYFSYCCFVLALFCLGISVVLFGYPFLSNFIAFFCKKGVIELYKKGDRAFYLSVGSYAENMQKILGSDKLVKKLKAKGVNEIAFAMGMDRTAQMKSSSTRGILSGVLELLKEKYGISNDTIQKKIDAKLPAPSKKALSLDLSEQLESQMDVPLDVRLLLVAQTRKGILAYGDCLSIDLSKELEHKTAIPMDVQLDVQLLLVANSKHATEIVNEENRDDLVYVEDGRKTVIDLFRYASEQDIDCVVVGAMGTNQGKAPYAVVLDTIITAYEWCQRQRKNACPRIVVLSVRERDIKDQELSLAYIVNRVRSTLKKLD